MDKPSKDFLSQKLPKVSIVMPVRNEATFIEQSLAAVLTQDYPHDRMEVLIANGMSSDGTRDVIARLTKSHDITVTVLANPGKIVPTGMNIGIRQARGDIIVRVDGHAVIQRDYVRLCVEFLTETGVDCVGGIVESVGSSYVGKAIATAMSSAFGVGGSVFRTASVSTKPALTDTVPFGVYRSEVFERIGLFNEQMVRHQDYEFSYRLRKAGGRIMLLPLAKAKYHVRTTLRSLWKQYWQYGIWKGRFIRAHPRSLKLRHLNPPLFVFALVVSVLLAIFSNPLAWTLGVSLGAYAIFISGALISLSIKGKFKYIPIMPAVFACLHMSWGLGIWKGLFSSKGLKSKHKKPKKAPGGDSGKFFVRKKFGQTISPVRKTTHFETTLATLQSGRAKEPIEQIKQQRHIVTVQLEDYFHVAAFNQVIGEKQWRRFESRLESNVEAVCNLLREFNIKATFFALGWIGDMQPKIIQRIVSEGHEIASGGYLKQSVKGMTPPEFQDDLRRAKKALENAGANKIIGYRCPHKRLDESDLWIFDILAEERYLYDASHCLPLKSNKKRAYHGRVHKHQTRHGLIWEIPMSAITLLGYNLPISGGNYLRQLPHFLMIRGFKKWCKDTEAPFVLYFHPWELDPDQPRVTSVGWTSRIRQYRNLDKMKWVLPIYFKQGQFQSISQHLNVALEYPDKNDLHLKEKGDSWELNLKKENLDSCAFHPMPVTIIIPCYNEASSLPYLKKALEEMIEKAQNRYDLHFIFVDDGSIDDTYAILQNLFGTENNCKIIRHNFNKGISAALLTGFDSADTEIVCSMDADCSYDPLTLLEMIPLLNGQVDLVTASPYHHHGHVLNVPGWRLFLSKSLSRIYQVILTNEVATCTSCFRIYRRSSILKLLIKHKDYLGIIELLAKLDIHGGVIAEYPTTLQCRIFGHSKMKIIQNIIGHLNVLAEITKYRRKFRQAQKV